MAEHKSVLLEECIQYLQINPRGVYVDGTVGLGGHSQEIARRLEEGGRLIAIDRDETAIAGPGNGWPPGRNGLPLSTETSGSWAQFWTAWV